MSRKARRKTARKPTAATHARRAADRFAAGEFAAAARHCRLALKADDGAADLWHLLAASLLEGGDPPAALTASRACLALAADVPDYLNTHALVLERCGDAKAAEAQYRDLLGRHPGHADAAYNLGRLLMRTGQRADARLCFEQTVKLRPQWGAAWKNLGLMHFADGDNDAAERCLSQALQLDPQDAECCINLGRLRQNADDFEAALRFHRMALEREADTATLLRLALLRPIFCADATEIAAHRERIEADLAHIAGADLSLDNPAVMLGAPTFFFAYHGLDDRPLVSRFGDIVAHAWTPPVAPPVVRAARRPRVAVVSAHFKQHTIGRLYAPLLERLPRADYELALLSVGEHDDAMTARLRAAADHALAVPNDHDAARAALHALDADVIFFPDVGMEPTTFWLAAERFAPVQSVGWGHPVTTGLPTMDCFISSRLLEPPDAAAHYREQLVELASWPVAYEDPGAPPAATLSRSELGFAAAERIYLCPQSLFKLHPDFDAYLGAILARDDAAVIVLISSNVAWRDKLGARFAARLGAAAERIRFLPGQSAAAFYALFAHADVVLDTLHFSGGITSFEAIWAETPLVTERGAFMRGRVTAALCDLLGFDAAIARGADDYAARACELAHAGPARDSARALLAANKHSLLELGDGVVAAYNDFFTGALEQAASADPARLAS